MATADDYNSVKVFRAPCVADEAPFLRGNGHSTHVENARFLNVCERGDQGEKVTGREALVSVGADSTILVWELTAVHARDEDMHRPAGGKQAAAWAWDGLLHAAQARVAFGRGHGLLEAQTVAKEKLVHMKARLRAEVRLRATTQRLNVSPS